MTDDTALECVRIFREVTGLNDKPRGNAMTSEDILAAPIGSFDIDSLDTMEFVMAVEDRFDVELDEQAINRCATLTDFTALVSHALSV
ncbi:MAG TPA: phosphopantetheine-binding protein [Rhizobiaceae bacterium]